MEKLMANGFHIESRIVQKKFSLKHSECINLHLSGETIFANDYAKFSVFIRFVDRYGK